MCNDAVTAHEQTAAIAFATSPLLYLRIDLPPTSEVEVADTEVASLGHTHRFGKGGEEMLFDSVENLGHLGTPRHSTSRTAGKLENLLAPL